MYDVDWLLRAIDTVMASAKSRLTTAEYELLTLIRSGIEENKSMEAVEVQVWRLLGFLLPIIEYLEKLI